MALILPLHPLNPAVPTSHTRPVPCPTFHKVLTRSHVPQTQPASDQRPLPHCKQESWAVWKPV
jgi:hypothetical protein